MLTLTITNPHEMTATERQMVVAFLGLATPIGLAAASTTERAAAAQQDRVTMRVEVAPQESRLTPPFPEQAYVENPRISPLDRPDVGRENYGEVDIRFAFDPIADTSDPAIIFAGSPPAVASVPIPPPVVPAVPSQAVQIAVSPPSAGIAPTVVPDGLELDARGLPWSEKIHASTKRKNADQTWTKKKNVGMDLTLQVEAEMRAILSVQSPASSAPLVVPPAQVIPEGVPLITPPVPPVPGAPLSFQDVMGQIVKWVAGGLITQTQVAEVAKRVLGGAQINTLHLRPDLAPVIHAELAQLARVPA